MDRIPSHTVISMRFLSTLLFASSLFAQFPMPSAAQEQKKEEAPEDPFGRQTPRSSIMRFLKATQDDNYHIAAVYLQVPPNRRETLGVKLAQDLQVLLDTSYNFPISLFSGKPEGAIEEGVPTEQDRMGEIRVGDETVDLVMVRVKDPQHGMIWLVASETLAHVPALSARVTGYEYIEKLPPGLKKHFLGLSLGQWLGAIVLGFVAYALAWVFVLLVGWMLRRTKYKMGKPPRGAVVLLAIFIHAQLIHLLVLPLLYRTYYRRTVWIIGLAGLLWLLMRGIDRMADMLRLRALASGDVAGGSWIVLGRRIVKALLFLIFVLVIFSALGYDMSTALAGLGIGGIAVALAAQKTIENLFGGVSVASDEVIRVGDTLRLGTTIGTVMDIGLRSTRLRTNERTELSIPNGQLALMNVENLSMRDKILFNTNLNLTYQTTMDQLHRVLLGIRQLFANDARCEPGGRVNFAGYAESSLQIEIWLYILTPDYNKFCQIREELLFSIATIVQEADSGFAFPSRTLYLVSESADGSGPQTALPAQANAKQPGSADLRLGRESA